MKKHFTKALTVSVLLLSIACNNEVEKQDAQVNDTLAREDTLAQQLTKVVKPAHPLYNDVARYIAGMPSAGTDGLDSSLRTTAEWKKFSDAFGKSWQKYDSTRLEVMRNWRNQELTEANASSKTIFYPFAGADFLNAYTFFPDADKFILIGLEPVGTLPDFNTQSKDSVNRYFHRINTSLHAILNFSFFRTKSMAIDFRNEELDGTIHVMLLFIARTGNTITDIKPVATNASGDLVYYTSFEEARKDTLKNRGVEIEFMGRDTVLKKAYYFSVNLADDMLKKNTAFTSFVSKQAPYNTYIKSASYLMYNPYFSVVRDDLVLGKSRYVLKDDSGFPLKFFTPESWEIQLYGTYSRPIPMFSKWYQEDLKAAYKDTVKVRPLPFGIGYNYKPGQSNLLLAKKKQEK